MRWNPYGCDSTERYESIAVNDTLISRDPVTVIVDNTSAIIRHKMLKSHPSMRDSAEQLLYGNKNSPEKPLNALPSEKIDTLIDYINENLSQEQLNLAEAKAIETCQQIADRSCRKLIDRLHAQYSMHSRLWKCIEFLGSYIKNRKSKENEEELPSSHDIIVWKTTLTMLQTAREYKELQRQNEPFQPQRNMAILIADAPQTTKKEHAQSESSSGSGH